MKPIWGLALSFLSLTVFADCESGHEAYRGESYQLAIQHLEPCAMAGDERAALQLPIAYRRIGDYEKAHMWSLIVRRTWRDEPHPQLDGQATNLSDEQRASVMRRVEMVGAKIRAAADMNATSEEGRGGDGM